MFDKQISLPTQLTVIRLIGSPLILPFFLVYLLPYNNLYVNGCLTVFFLLFSVTDFFDGFFARRLDSTTLLGAALDPIADKSLLYSTIISLLAAGKLHFIWAIILIGREFFVMGIRQIALEHNVRLTVSYIAKMKTFVQSCALAFIIFNPYQYLRIEALRWNGVEFILLIAATVLSLVSAKQYCEVCLQQLDDIEWL